MQTKSKCDQCSIDYPVGLVNRLNTSRGVANVCGICALDLANQLHGQSRTKFDGVMAEAARQAAIDYRKQIGWTAPCK